MTLRGPKLPYAAVFRSLTVAGLSIALLGGTALNVAAQESGEATEAGESAPAPEPAEVADEPAAPAGPESEPAAEDAAPAAEAEEAMAEEPPVSEEDDADAEAKARQRRSGAAAAVEDILITGTKKARGQLVQDAPTAVTAFGSEQLEAFQFRDIESLTFAMPNVSLDSVGTVKGVANFSIRGLGANSSIPTIDPTVGLFINGVYMGSNVGAVLDSFDLEGVEVLRGPQGILFGRNVTGGAVLLRTRRPGDTYSASVKANIETGAEYRLYAGVDLPLDPEYVKVRVSGQYRNDEGWFTNMRPVDNFNPAAPEFVEESFGTEGTWLIRPTVTLTPTDEITLHVTFEHGETEAQGPPSQNSSRSSPNFIGPFDDFDFSIDEPGFANFNWNQVFGEVIIDLGENGQITDIFGFRVVTAQTLSDIDSQPLQIFSANTGFQTDHWSNELRYTGEFFDEFMELTIGTYIFGQKIQYRENRIIQGGAIDSTFGGDQDQLSLGAFTQFEFRITNELKAILGGRVTYETKEADVATFNPASPCPGPDTFEGCTFDFEDDEDWLNFAPKIGAQYTFSPGNQVYGHWTRGFRSGGYNMRNTNPNAAPGPFDEETQDVFEIGMKGSVLDRKLRFGIAGYWTIMNDLQRELNISDPELGVLQFIENAADANVYGFEIDASAQILPELSIFGSFGFTDSDYTNVQFDLNGDGVLDSGDEDLTLPRLENISANIGALLDIDLGSTGLVTLRGTYSYRDDSFFTDNNQGLLPSGHIVDASIALTLADIDMGSYVVVPKITFYGRNLLDEAFLGGQTPLGFSTVGFANQLPDPAPAGSNFSPLKEGRVFGAELRIDWL